jgi:ATP-binding protein involved in chromosome partitioning
MDPRPAIITTRFHHIKTVIAVASGKGGVGKSMIATTLALTFTQQGHRVGLFDLDVYGPSTHLILGTPPTLQPTEDKGIIPPQAHGLSFMSPVFFTQGKPTPLRGPDITNMILELLAITQWGPLDYLILDMPPGIGDETLDVIHYLPHCTFLVVTTPSKVAQGAVDKLLDILQELHHPILGVLENMTTNHSPTKDIITKRNLRYLGSLPYDTSLETAVGKPDQILTTPFGQALKKLLRTIERYAASASSNR